MSDNKEKNLNGKNITLNSTNTNATDNTHINTKNNTNTNIKRNTLKALNPLNSSSVANASNKSNPLYILPKYEKYMEYVIDNVVSKLPRIEKFNIGNEIKLSLFEGIKYIVMLSKVDNKNKLEYINMIDANISVQRIYIRIIYKKKYLDNRRYMYVMDMLSEIGKMIGGYIKWVRE